MLFQGDPAYDAAFATRTPLEVDIDKAGANVAGIFKSARVRREISGDLPASVSLIGGAASSRATLELDAAAPGAPSMWVADDRDDWLAAPVTIEAGYGGQTVRTFTGRVRSMGVSEAKRAGTVELLDPSDDMRAPVTLHTWGSYVTRAQPTRVRRFPTNAAAVIVAALHANGLRVTPEPRYREISGGDALCVASVPFAFGALAERGWTVPAGAGVASGEDAFAEGQFGWMPRRFSDGVSFWGCTVYPRISGSSGWGPLSKHRVEFWAHREGGVAATPIYLNVGPNRRIAFTWESTGVAYLQTTTATVLTDVDRDPARVLSAGWHHVSFEVTNAGDARLWLDGVLVSSVTGLAAGTTGAGSSIAVESMGRIQALHWYAGTTGVDWETVSPLTPAVLNFTPDADVDRARLELEAVPPIDGRAGWDLCREVAEAELGMVTFTESGRFAFRNRDSLNAATTPVVEWGVDLVDDLNGTVNVDSIRTRITALVERHWLMDAGRGAESVLGTAVPSFLLGDVLELPTGGSTFYLEGSQPFVASQAFVSQITAAGGGWTAPVGWVLCNDAGGVARYTGTFVSARVEMVGPSTMRLDVVNSSGAPRFVCWPAEWAPSGSETPHGMGAGSPALWVLGYSQIGASERQSATVNVSDAVARGKWGDRTYELSSSKWRQDPIAVEAFAQSLLADMAEPRVQLRDVSVPADLRLQLGDPVRLTDWSGRVPPIVARIIRSDVTIAHHVESGMVGTYALRAIPE